MDETTTTPAAGDAAPLAAPAGIGEDRANPPAFDPRGEFPPSTAATMDERPTLIPGAPAAAPPPAVPPLVPPLVPPADELAPLPAAGTVAAFPAAASDPTTTQELPADFDSPSSSPLPSRSDNGGEGPGVRALGDFDPATFVSQVAERVAAEVHKAIQGQEEIVETALVALLAGGHALFEGVPGTAKTLLVRCLAAACDAQFKRIQFTPDLMPSDISGTNVFDISSSQFHLRRGPIFSEIVLADEINRTPPKTQAALLEAMEERRVSIDGTPNPLPPIFTVFATQNPVEYEGTYPLPEAQLDRFLVKVVVPYPAEDAEMRMLSAWDRGFKSGDLATANIQAVVNVEEILKARSALPRVTVEPKIIGYITTIVRRTRESRQLTLGASPRASVALLQASKALALMRGRNFVIPDDVKAMTLPVLRHRVLLRPEAEIEGIGPDRVLTSLVEGVEVPR